MKQTDRILKAILDNPQKKVWYAKDFQYGKYFVGYEATARMSDLIRMYPNLFNVGKDGRFRTIELNWENEKEINEMKKLLDSIGEDNGNNK